MRGSWIGILVTIFVPAVGLTGQALDEPRVRAMGFGDLNYLVTELDRPEGFRLGQMVGHVIADLDEGFTFFGEVSLTGRDSGYSIEVERAALRYDFSDALKISAGRFHTPIGYWNTAFHHGSWLQTSVARPEMIKFGSRFVPTHFVGLIAEGGLPANPLGLGYMWGSATGGPQTSHAQATPVTSTINARGSRASGLARFPLLGWSWAQPITETNS